MRLEPRSNTRPMIDMITRGDLAHLVILHLLKTNNAIMTLLFVGRGFGQVDPEVLEGSVRQQDI